MNGYSWARDGLVIMIYRFAARERSETTIYSWILGQFRPGIFEFETFGLWILFFFFFPIS